MAVCKASIAKDPLRRKALQAAAVRRWKANTPLEKRQAIARKSNVAYRARHPEKLASSDRRKRQKNPELYRAIDKRKKEARPELYDVIRRTSKAKRRAAELHRNVAWADHAKIKEIYAHARVMSEMLGEVWHVDHVIPLQGKLVSGLHVHNNLQILPGIENIRKGNRFQVEFQQDSRDLCESKAESNPVRISARHADELSELAGNTGPDSTQSSWNTVGEILSSQ